MSKGNRYIAIIPARGGSKRLPGKNLLEIAGKPLLAWTVEAAVKSGIFERIIVSTDSPELAEIARKFGAEVPFTRPAGLATDKSSSVDVLEHSLITLGLDGKSEYSHFACLQPTSPLRTAADLKAAGDLLAEKKADAVISVCKTEHSPLWSNTLSEDGSMGNFLNKELQKTPSQDLPIYYRLNGAIYFCSIERFLTEKTLFLGSNIYAYEMSRRNSIDIDDEVDFDLAHIYLTKS